MTAVFQKEQHVTFHTPQLVHEYRGLRFPPFTWDTTRWQLNIAMENHHF